MSDDPAFQPITLISTREALTQAEALQLEAELETLRRHEQLERRIWRGLLGLFAACALIMIVQTLRAWADGRLG